MNNPERQRLFTFASGGWVLLVAGLITLALAAWALAPAVLRMGNRPPGDGKNIASYGFDLSNLAVPRDLVVAAMLHRDMVPVVSDPAILQPSQIGAINKRQRGKYLVSSDRVIGVVINDQPRAYPISVLNVHEIINDELGGVPIAVTFHPLCDSALVFDRRVDGDTVEFGISGLVYNSNMLMYEKRQNVKTSKRQNPSAVLEDSDEGDLEEASLWSQLLVRAVSGPLAGTELSVVPSSLMRWSDWLALHPNTTLIDRDTSLTKRYQKASPDQYLHAQKLLFPVRPLPAGDSHAGLGLKSKVVAISIGDMRRVCPVQYVARRIEQSSNGSAKSWTDTLGETAITFRFDAETETLTITSDQTPGDPPLIAVPALWFAWHAMHPNDEVAGF